VNAFCTRYVGSEHSEVLAEIHARSFIKAWSANDIAKILDQSGATAWMVEDDEPAAFILVRHASDESEILTLAVNPHARRKSYASALIRSACDRLHKSGINKIYLEVADDNTAARALYSKHGFTVTGRRRAYYNEPEKSPVDAIVMAKEI